MPAGQAVDSYLRKMLCWALAAGAGSAGRGEFPQAAPRDLARRAQYADLTLDVTARRLTRGGREIALTRTEFGLLELLLRNAERVISYDVIRERVWGYDEAPASNALQVFVGFLRRKLEDGGGVRLLHNVRGVGS
jgi:two-component system, OmpR family, response regulator MprA